MATAHAFSDTAARALPRFNFTVPVKQVLGGQKPSVIASNASSFRAAIGMIKGRLNSLVVSDDSGGMAGIVTERDFLKLPLEKGQSRSTLVSELMTPVDEIHSVPPSYTVQKCVSAMRKLKVRHLPVVNKGDVTAVLSMQDISEQILKSLRREEASMTVGDLLDSAHTPSLKDISISSTAPVSKAIEQMRAAGSGSLLVRISGTFMPYAPQFGIFTERDYVHSVVPFDEESPKDVKLEDVARFTSGSSKATMHEISSGAITPNTYRPSDITCVERKTKVRDALSLMLGHGLLYVPVTDDKKPVSVISMRDINLFLAPSMP